MKAAIYTKYGPPDVVEIREVEKPVPKDDEVLVKVRAASVNPVDWRLMRGVPPLLRILFRVPKPTITQPRRLGSDMAGQVEAIGRNVTQFRPGDEVFGVCSGAFAEYACASETKLAMKPDNVTYEQAASVPVAALTALQGLRDKGKIQPGQKVLINGAAGGVGTVRVENAKRYGAGGTAPCRMGDGGFGRTPRRGRVVVYIPEDFHQEGRQY